MPDSQVMLAIPRPGKRHPTYRDLLPAADRGLADDLQPLIAQIAAKGRSQRTVARTR